MTQPATPDAKAIIDEQVKIWRKEIYRLQDLVSYATGESASDREGLIHILEQYKAEWPGEDRDCVLVRDAISACIYRIQHHEEEKKTMNGSLLEKLCTIGLHGYYQHGDRIRPVDAHVILNVVGDHYHEELEAEKITEVVIGSMQAQARARGYNDGLDDAISIIHKHEAQHTMFKESYMDLVNGKGII